MKILKKFILVFVLLPVFVQASLFSISETEINHYLDTRLKEKVPLQDKVGIPGLFELDYYLYDLSTQIGQTEEKRIELKGVVEGVLNLKGKQRDAKIALHIDALPFYDAEKGALFLQGLRLMEWKVTPEKYQDDLQMFIPLFFDGITAILAHQPVYTLDENKMKEAIVKKFGKAIVVEKGRLVLQTSIF